MGGGAVKGGQEADLKHCSLRGTTGNGSLFDEPGMPPVRVLYHCLTQPWQQL